MFGRKEQQCGQLKRFFPMPQQHRKHISGGRGPSPTTCLPSRSVINLFPYQQVQPLGDRKPQPERDPEVTETGGFQVFKPQKLFLRKYEWKRRSTPRLRLLKKCGPRGQQLWSLLPTHIPTTVPKASPEPQLLTFSSILQ